MYPCTMLDTNLCSGLTFRGVQLVSRAGQIRPRWAEWIRKSLQFSAPKGLLQRRQPSESANSRRLRRVRPRPSYLKRSWPLGTARLESILRRGLDREAAIDLNAMVRRDEFPPLDLCPVQPSQLPDRRGRGMHRQNRALMGRPFLWETLAMTGDWLLLDTFFERAESGIQPHRGGASGAGYASRHHTTMQPVPHAPGRGRTRERPMWHESRPACGTGTGRVFSTTWSWSLSRTLRPEDVPHAAASGLSHPEANRPSCASSCLRSHVVPALESYTYVTTTGDATREETSSSPGRRSFTVLVVSQITLLYMRDPSKGDPRTRQRRARRACTLLETQLRVTREYRASSALRQTAPTYSGAQPAMPGTGRLPPPIERSRFAPPALGSNRSLRSATLILLAIPFVESCRRSRQPRLPAGSNQDEPPRSSSTSCGSYLR